MSENMQVKHGSSPSLVSHSVIHSDLLMYQELTKWLKDCQTDIFAELKEVSALYRYSSCRVDSVICVCTCTNEMQAYVRAFHHVCEEQLKVLLSESRYLLQQSRSIDFKKSGGFKFGASTADIRSSLAGSMSSLSPARGNALTTSMADFSVSPSFSAASPDLSRGPV